MKWFLVTVFLLLVAAVFGLGMPAYALYALLAVLLVSRWITRRWAEDLAATRECNQVSVRVGDTVAVVIQLTNRGPLPVAWALIEDLLPRDALLFDPPKLKVRGGRLQLLMLKARGRKTLHYQLTCNCRGYYQLGPLVLETGDLFGLHRRYRTLAPPHFLLVYPEVIPLEGWDVASRRPIGEVRMTYRLFEDPTRIAGVRDYQAGDPLNRVHWRATARVGELQSKIYEPSTVTGVTLMLEFSKEAHAAENEPYRSELAVTAAASIANAVYQMGHQVGLVTNGRDAVDRIRQEGWDHDFRTRQALRRSAAMATSSDRLAPLVVPTERGAEQLQRILETLARVELTDGLSMAQLVQETIGRLPRDATVLALLPTASVETALALGTLVRQGFAVTAILNAPDGDDFVRSAGRLMAEGIETRPLRDRDGVTTVCQNLVLHA